MGDWMGFGGLDAQGHGPGFSAPPFLDHRKIHHLKGLGQDGPINHRFPRSP